jgi:DNA-directed RNA polymerase specialized sigma24 family protein
VDGYYRQKNAAAPGAQPRRARGTWPAYERVDLVGSEYIEALRQVLSAFPDISDRLARARMATEALEMIGSANGQLGRLRRDDIRAMHGDGMSYREIGEVIGVHWTRVRQLAQGMKTGNSSAARKARAAEAPPSAGAS